MKKIKISLCGDLFIARRIPQSWSGQLYDIMNQYDCRYGNLETTIHRREGYPAAFPGGGYAMADPLCLKDLKSFGFNFFSTANNHSMDYSEGGLLATINYLDEFELFHSGTGKNLAEASRATFFEHEKGRVALISLTSSFHDSYMAGPQNEEMLGRPGVNPLRFNSVYELDDSRYDLLEKLLFDTGINNQVALGEKHGFLTKSENLRFGTSYYRFKRGSSCKKVTTPNQEDLDRTVSQIKDAKLHCEIVIVSIHSHQFDGMDRREVPGFVSSFAESCIEAGADIIVCTGPHVLRGIKEYKGGIIFYGLGNFIFQNELEEFLPEELYNRYGLSRHTSTGTAGLYDKRSNHGQKGLKLDNDVWKSVMVGIEVDVKYLKIVLYPVEITRTTGLPVLSKTTTILDEISEMSIRYNTHIDIDKNNKIGSIIVKR